MKDINSIFNEYKNSDSDKRLSLCLQHRMLREEFLEIDMDESIIHKENKESKPKELTSIWNIFKSI